MSPESGVGPGRLRTAAWAVGVGSAWYVWLAIGEVLSRALLGLVNRTGQHPDSDLILFALFYACAALYLILVGYVGHRLIERLHPPLAVWEPGVLVVVAAALAEIAVRQGVLGSVPRSVVISTIVLPFVLAPAAVLVGIGLAAVRRRGRA